MKQDFLFELGTEELPPKALKTLIKSLAESVYTQLDQLAIAYDKSASQIFAAPRRLAIRVVNLSDTTPESEILVWGPPAKVCFDNNSQLTKAASAFAEKNGLDKAFLKSFIKNDGKIDKLCCSHKTGGESITSLLPSIINQTLKDLPIPKRMRWGARKSEFVRPVHWVVMMYGKSVIDCEIMECKAGRISRGHRFHSSGDIEISSPAEYQQTLREHYIEACFKIRRNKISDQVEAIAQHLGGKAVIDRDLLDEVTALVEWPVALAGSFEKKFLEVPQEALITSMSEHQKYFHVVNEHKRLLPHFITISNIESTDSAQVISGNERVIRPRLTDAAFFFKQDKKRSLESRLDDLKAVLFQEKLGSLYDKSLRVSRISAHIAAQTGLNKDFSARAGLLCKSDLSSNMVLEFDSMQGIAGQYYADNDGESPEVGVAIREHYLPKHAGSAIPATNIGAAVALADRLDTLIGIFGIGQKPTGSKDPFALRRAAIGVLNIILGHKLDLGLFELLSFTAAQHQEQHNCFTKPDLVVTEVLDYVMERFRSIYLDQSISSEVFNSVAAKNLSNAYDFSLRIHAVSVFVGLPEAAGLAAANKRVANILSKSKIAGGGGLKTDLLEQTEEKLLSQLIQEQELLIKPLLESQAYAEALKSLSSLRDAVDSFFDKVMVNVENEALRNNRLQLLFNLRKLFLSIADISNLVPENK